MNDHIEVLEKLYSAALVESTDRNLTSAERQEAAAQYRALREAISSLRQVPDEGARTVRLDLSVFDQPGDPRSNLIARGWTPPEANPAPPTSGDEGPYPEPGPEAYEDGPTPAQSDILDRHDYYEPAIAKSPLPKSYWDEQRKTKDAPAQAGAELPELLDHCEYLDVWVDGCHVERPAADLFYTADQMRDYAELARMGGS